MFDMPRNDAAPPNDPAADVDAKQVRQRRIGQFLIAGPALFFTLFALHGIFSDLGDVRREQTRSAARTAQAVGKVVEVHYRYSYRARKSFPIGTVAFATAGGDEVRLALALEPGEGVGLTTPVYYDPDDPKNNATRNDTYGW